MTCPAPKLPAATRHTKMRNTNEFTAKTVDWGPRPHCPDVHGGVAQRAGRVRGARVWGHRPVSAAVSCLRFDGDQRSIQPRPGKAVLEPDGDRLPVMVCQPDSVDDL